MSLSVVDLVVLLLGLAIGAVGAWLLLRSQREAALALGRAEGTVERTALDEQRKAALREAQQLAARIGEHEAQAERLRGELDQSRRQAAQLAERAGQLPAIEQTLALLRTQSAAERDRLQATLAETQAELRRASTLLEQERRQSQEKLALLSEAREQLSNQFKALASEILDEKSRKFTEQNQVNLGQLLNPLQERISAFQSKVEEVYVNEGKDRSALTEQVRQLMALNATLSADANNLTLALKGDRKAQGNWGEIILDDVLEKAGLLPGQHYERQGSVKAEDGQSHVIPDVVIRLPGERHLVVDSKLTLPDYRAFSASNDEAERTAALKRHLTAIRAHIKGLSEKNYQSLFGLKSIDFVVMFIPLEPAFTVAVTHDNELFQHAWERNVLLVSPSTLLFVIRTVAHLWRQEGLSRNAKDISRRGAELYDKLVGFVEDLNRVGERLQAAQDSYSAARNKFSSGKGNVIRQAEMLRDLGVKPTKALPGSWVEGALDEPGATLESLGKPPA